ncbi:MAG: hypothetical protein JXB49_05345 [Bacteroidales bacterium]|nr:hypothetical protein [Bacteroidales bacterium]
MIKLNIEVLVEGGPKMSAFQSIPVEAYDKIEIDIPGGDNANPGTATIEVQPGGTGQVKFLSVISTLYDPKITYAVDGGNDIVLDAPQLFLGSGSVGLLGTTQNSFVFNNEVGVDKPASIKILVGRDATP